MCGPVDVKNENKLGLHALFSMSCFFSIIPQLPGEFGLVNELLASSTSTKCSSIDGNTACHISNSKQKDGQIGSATATNRPDYLAALARYVATAPPTPPRPPTVDDIALELFGEPDKTNDTEKTNNNGDVVKEDSDSGRGRRGGGGRRGEDNRSSPGNHADASLLLATTSNSEVGGCLQAGDRVLPVRGNGDPMVLESISMSMPDPIVREYLLRWCLPKSAAGRGLVEGGVGARLYARIDARNGREGGGLGRGGGGGVAGGVLDEERAEVRLAIAVAEPAPCSR